MFPPSNAISKADASYFHMIQREGHLHHHPHNNSKGGIEDANRSSPLSLSSNAVSQAYREYFHIVKTEDGLSQFIKSDRKDEDVEENEGHIYPVMAPPAASIPPFLHHKVYSEDGTPVMGIYLTNDNLDQDVG